MKRLRSDLKMYRICGLFWIIRSVALDEPNQLFVNILSFSFGYRRSFDSAFTALLFYLPLPVEFVWLLA